MMTSTASGTRHQVRMSRGGRGG
ncbi:hypothetical protein Hamer_G025559 [Homarus americanus]|uniref:Uncharacterized protein n=1 Tax=Homarus americanus TaxID=6706 RepID=A0A8J5JMM6_HOMAM|nr:hypothetical protein Hamer_G025559 [Homarus americanus]